MSKEYRYEELRPNSGYGKFASKVLMIAILSLSAAMAFAAVIERGTVHVIVYQIGGFFLLSVFVAMLIVFLLATYVHILNCMSLRRISKERKMSCDNNNQIYQPKKQNSNED